MKTLGRLMILFVCVAGCDGATQQQKPGSRQTEIALRKTVGDYIASWGAMGMWLPDVQQVRVFRDNFDAARDGLIEALSHSDKAVRMRAAYVIGQIGIIARPSGQELLARLTDESDVLVRIYIVNALNLIGYDNQATVALLVERYNALDGTNVPPNVEVSYAPVDEKITIACAIYSLTNDESNSEYYDFVTGWLDPPDKSLNSVLLDGYWERRWIAVNSLERMPAAKNAIPKLESLQSEPNSKPWVSVHVPRVLETLRKDAR